MTNYVDRVWADGESWNAENVNDFEARVRTSFLNSAVAGAAPTSHAASHAAGSIDPISPASIGAATVTALNAKADQSALTSGLAMKANTSTVEAALANKADLVNGLIPTAQIPARALVSVSVVASQSAQLALTTQEGDIVIRTDLVKNYVRNSGTTGTMTDYTLLDVPMSAVSSVNGQTGTVVLSAADVGAIASSARGMANGVASLDGSTLIPTSQLPTDAAANVGSARTLGTGALQAAAGNDSRLGGIPSRGATASFTLAETDRGMAIEVNSSSLVTITVPSSLSAGFTCVVRRFGTGAVTFAEGSGAQVNADGGRISAAGKKSISKQFLEASVRYTSLSEYSLQGALAA